VLRPGSHSTMPTFALQRGQARCNSEPSGGDISQRLVRFKLSIERVSGAQEGGFPVPTSFSGLEFVLNLTDCIPTAVSPGKFYLTVTSRTILIGKINLLNAPAFNVKGYGYTPCSSLRRRG
jgi:hypothetical protein